MANIISSRSSSESKSSFRGIFRTGVTNCNGFLNGLGMPMMPDMTADHEFMVRPDWSWSTNKIFLSGFCAQFGQAREKKNSSEHLGQCIRADLFCKKRCALNVTKLITRSGLNTAFRKYRHFFLPDCENRDRRWSGSRISERILTKDANPFVKGNRTGDSKRLEVVHGGSV